MTPEQWQQIKDLLDRALELAPERRATFLDQSCKDNLSLRQEVESLLALEGRVTAFLDSPPRLELKKATRLGDYDIQSLIGAGGMGEVYRARDLRLQRDVAIKVLPAFAFPSPDRMRRFEQEARAAAALNHPNILAVYQLGEYGGAPYLVSELLEGETLREHLKLGPLPVRKAIDWLLQISRGLTAAHDRGIVHRDLKPENIFVTWDGHIKILDFGLAKLIRPKVAVTAGTETISAETATGVIMGTVGYMSPEQVRGKDVDQRSDVFALGAIAYEMLSGQRAFKGESKADTISAILTQEPPPLSTSPQAIPIDIDRIVRRCLAKNPEDRWQSVREMASALETPSDSSSLTRETTAVSSGGRRWIAVSVILLLAAAVVAGGLYRRFHPTKPLTDEDMIVLADFDNKTGDTVFDDTLKQALVVDLRQSPFLNILSDAKVSGILRLMGREHRHVTPEVAKEICIRSGSKAVLAGSITSLGSEYIVDLEATACSTGDTLVKEQAEATSKEGVLKALGTAATRLRAKLGESLASVQKFDTPLEATTSSLEALRAYSMGGVAQRTKGDAEAIPFYKRAVELDPNFALAYASLGVSYANLWQASLAAENIKKAYELRDRVSELEKYHISALYYRLVTGEAEKAIQAYEAWIQSYPKDMVPRTTLGTLFSDLGQWDKAAVQYEGALPLGNHSVTYANLACDYLALNRLNDANAIIEQARQRKVDSGEVRQQAYLLAFLNNDIAGMEAEVAWARGSPGDEDSLLSMQSDTEAYYGRLSRAREFSRRAVESATRAGSPETAAFWQGDAALREAEVGNVAAARQQSLAALALSRGLDVSIVSALTLARIGDLADAKNLMRELEKNNPSNTVLTVYWLPTISAAIEVNRGNPKRALALLEPSAPYELGSARTYINYLYPAYVRGQAYLVARNGSAAASEFQKLLDHRGIVLNFVTGALAHLQIGRAYAMAGDSVKARTAYENFLALWKNADPDIPILKQAKAEYANLH